MIRQNRLQALEEMRRKHPIPAAIPIKKTNPRPANEPTRTTAPYIISSKLFEALPTEEKKLWHSHVYEVKSGQLIAPRIAEAAEMEVMKGLVGTYGKTWYTWQVDRGDKVPLGIPQLMMAFTADGQTDPQLIADYDKQCGISSDERKKSRADIGAPAIQPGADAWQKGEAIQLQTKIVTMKEAP